MSKSRWLVLFSMLTLLLSACGQPASTARLEKVGLLVTDSINDQVWGTKGYKGLLKIQSKFGIDVYYQEDIIDKAAAKQAVKEFEEKGVNLIFGHGSEYAKYFNSFSKEFPNIHFITFNGDANGDNVTSINFKADAMGFFGGMVAGKMTETNKVGVIAAFEWQPEVNGFFEGAAFQNPDVEVEISYTNSWDNVDSALRLLDKMVQEGVDVVYPAGDGYNVPVIEALKEQGLYSIGFVTDQSYLGEATVLTSTVQHVDELYEFVAESYNKGELESGDLFFDFQDGVISMGKFSPEVDPDFEKEINAHVETYIQTGLLPNEK
ncbi:BMP family ABC transporter substrate-binding protein [Cytobacillus sp. S13-E01]|uniref:BMP family ABC transporter substrate-binding protein n=1 Tax=Cytobacillus sp. S13-E01 TaxID=3031326 RepID=UPI0023D7C05C|nr:BMP family ABC transporter substrate-binding protein [Cytobacillus sp. S13-E01]MDF0728602.1 BMP family ABC transporter substrate-binding protein [Cytobacillus sp. S13-E01]